MIGKNKLVCVWAAKGEVFLSKEKWPCAAVRLSRKLSSSKAFLKQLFNQLLVFWKFC